MDPSGKKGIFVGYCEVSKALKIYILGLYHIDISRDVTFDEKETLKISWKCQHEEVHEEDVPPRKAEATLSLESETSEDHDMVEPHEPHTMDISWNINPTWVIETYKKHRSMELQKAPQE